ncbi:MAG: hypothetical protein ABS935_12230 [Solibacillus sp.]
MKRYVVENWDINRILKLAPVDAPVKILKYGGVPCSVHGEPLNF